MRLPCNVGEELRGVDRRREVEPLGRCRGTGVCVIGSGEQCCHVFQWSPSEPDIHHGANQHPNHALKEPVRLDLKAYALAVGPMAPVRKEMRQR